MEKWSRGVGKNLTCADIREGTFISPRSLEEPRATGVARISGHLARTIKADGNKLRPWECVLNVEGSMSFGPCCSNAHSGYWGVYLVYGYSPSLFDALDWRPPNPGLARDLASPLT